MAETSVVEASVHVLLLALLGPFPDCWKDRRARVGKGASLEEVELLGR